MHNSQTPSPEESETRPSTKRPRIADNTDEFSRALVPEYQDTDNQPILVSTENIRKDGEDTDETNKLKKAEENHIGQSFSTVKEESESLSCIVTASKENIAGGIALVEEELSSDSSYSVPKSEQSDYSCSTSQSSVQNYEDELLDLKEEEKEANTQKYLLLNRNMEKTYIDDFDATLTLDNQIEKPLLASRSNINNIPIPRQNEIEFKFSVKPADLADRLFSEEKEVNGVCWKGMLYPYGTSQFQTHADKFTLKNLSVFVKVRPATNDTDPYWTLPPMYFHIAVINQNDWRNSIYFQDQHQFCAEETDRGWHRVLENKNAEEFITPQSEVVVRIGVFPQRSGAYRKKFDPTKETPSQFRGLKNHGATCYMNSLLQSLFYVGDFRRAVFEMTADEEPDLPSEIGDDTESHREVQTLDFKDEAPVSEALQNLFYQLQRSESHTVSCKELIKSFGWDAADAFTQHDAQEFNRLLCDRLEERMKGTRSEGTIRRLFEGESEAFIRCLDVDFISTRKETFHDLQVDVKNVKGLKESLHRYLEPEILEGQNLYEADGYGKQRAEKGLRFIKFPPILQFHLRRVTFDMQMMDMVKVYDRFEFPETLDLSDLVPDAGEYQLHSVVVHSGDVNMGHYWAYMRPDNNETWMRFDDESVTVASEREAIDSNFGGADVLPFNYFQGEPAKSIDKIFSAYILFYVKKSEADELLRGPDPDLVNHSFVKRLKWQAYLADRTNLKKNELIGHVKIRLLVESDFRGMDFTNLMDWETKSSLANKNIICRKRTLTVLELQNSILEMIRNNEISGINLKSNEILGLYSMEVAIKAGMYFLSPIDFIFNDLAKNLHEPPFVNYSGSSHIVDLILLPIACPVSVDLTSTAQIQQAIKISRPMFTSFFDSEPPDPSSQLLFCTGIVNYHDGSCYGDFLTHVLQNAKKTIEKNFGNKDFNLLSRVTREIAEVEFPDPRSSPSRWKVMLLSESAALHELELGASEEVHLPRTPTQVIYYKMNSPHSNQFQTTENSGVRSVQFTENRDSLFGYDAFERTESDLAFRKALEPSNLFFSGQHTNMFSWTGDPPPVLPKYFSRNPKEWMEYHANQRKLTIKMYDPMLILGHYEDLLGRLITSDGMTSLNLQPQRTMSLNSSGSDVEEVTPAGTNPFFAQDSSAKRRNFNTSPSDSQEITQPGSPKSVAICVTHLDIDIRTPFSVVFQYVAWWLDLHPNFLWLFVGPPLLHSYAYNSTGNPLSVDADLADLRGRKKTDGIFRLIEFLSSSPGRMRQTLHFAVLPKSYDVMSPRDASGRVGLVVRIINSKGQSVAACLIFKRLDDNILDLVKDVYELLAENREYLDVVKSRGFTLKYPVELYRIGVEEHDSEVYYPLEGMRVRDLNGTVLDTGGEIFNKEIRFELDIMKKFYYRKVGVLPTHLSAIKDMFIQEGLQCIKLSHGSRARSFGRQTHFVIEVGALWKDVKQLIVKALEIPDAAGWTFFEENYGGYQQRLRDDTELLAGTNDVIHIRAEHTHPFFRPSNSRKTKAMHMRA
eukprot:GHVP01049367.1.p1 GENE.GHVP01049367.1~~GHVP01049367.1.p1  ORF type:complete len:1527 (-),score=250.65 GHVP01049367.1:1159-5739(-)